MNTGFNQENERNMRNANVNANNVEAQDLGNKFRLQPYSNITLILTDKCNLRCSYCYEHLQPNAGKKTMPWEIAKKGLDMFYSQVGENMNYTSISLFGGEPHLAFDVIKKVVEYTIRHRTIGGYKGSRFNYSLNTNGTIMNDEIFDLYSKLGKRINVRLSIDGFREKHDVTRKTISGDGSWVMLERNFKRYLSLRDDYGVKLTSVTTINKSNFRDIYYNFTKIYELTGISYIGALIVHEEQWTDEDFEVILEQVSLLYDYCLRNKMIFPICQIKPEKLDPVHICSAGLTSFIVDYRGELYPCHRCYFYDVGSFYRMGNVDTGINISKRRLMYEVNNMMNMPRKCNECHSTIRAKCHICFATNTVAYKDPYNISHKFCLFQKQLHYMLVDKWQKHKNSVVRNTMG